VGTSADSTAMPGERVKTKRNSSTWVWKSVSRNLTWKKNIPDECWRPSPQTNSYSCATPSGSLPGLYSARFISEDRKWTAGRTSANNIKKENSNANNPTTTKGNIEEEYPPFFSYTPARLAISLLHPGSGLPVSSY